MLILAVIVLYVVMPWLFGPCYYIIRQVTGSTDASINTIAFGSCASGNDDLAIFDEINADAIVFLGDNVYGDTTSPLILQIMYNRLSCKSSFQRLVYRTKYVMAIWDDHDFGSNDIGADNPIKYESQSIFLDFWRIPDASERRRLSGGVYGSYKFNTGTGQTTVSIIMPDLRFFREPLQLCTHGEYYPRQGCYCPANRSMLGEVQWAWLKDVISKSQRNDALTIIASSTQFGHSANGYESWTNFPLDRARLLALLDPSKSLIISGDAHWAEISTVNGLIDATSSGFSEVDPNVMPNQNRVGDAVPERNYGLIRLSDKTLSIYGLGHKLLLSVNIKM
jgi:alkaline phosphatase D